MDLHGGAPFWLLRNAFCDIDDALPASVDVVVIGSGITGALIADALVTGGRTVAIVERRSVTEGSTAASTALLLYELDLELGQLAGRIGEVNAVRAYQRLAVSIRRLGEIADSLPDRIDYQRSDSLYLAAHVSHVARLEREVALRRAAGLDARWVPAEELRRDFGLDAHGAIHTTCAAEVDPVRFSRALLERARRGGATLSIRTTASRLAEDGDSVRVTTNRGTIEAKFVVCATGYETPEGLLPPTVELQSTFVFVTEPLPDPGPFRSGLLMWESNRPYLYARLTPDQRLLVGGADIERSNPAARDALIPRRQRMLAEQLSSRFHGVEFEASHAWAGTIASAPDSLPYIGPVQGLPRVLVALGAGGNGIPFAEIAAELITAICTTGRPDRDAALFDPCRAVA